MPKLKNSNLEKFNKLGTFIKNHWGILFFVTGILVSITLMLKDLNYSFYAILILVLSSIPGTHWFVGMLMKKEKIKNDSPRVVLWMGLISTFVGFLLSTGTSDIISNLQEKEKLIGQLEIASTLAGYERSDIAVGMKGIINDIKNDKEPYNYFEELDDALEPVRTNGEFYKYLSYSFINIVLHDRLRKEAWKFYNESDNDLERLQGLELIIFSNSLKRTLILNELNYIEDHNTNKLSEVYTHTKERYLDGKEEILNKKMEDYTSDDAVGWWNMYNFTVHDDDTWRR
ncbi:hypothetical protein [Peribacillus simplex]|uniref:hypothetical protein n=1 Tax=Peribacillus simplex TaxID=1478 RepID=UPI0028532EA8|nr:hypothetical protein [Peribacillus simplex]MDR4927221.1 hypothetical protein [Peribacillus simplex]